MASKHVLVAKGLHRSYGSKVAVEDISLQIKRGQIYGLLGPNGAGKSTTIKMMVGLLKPDAGDVWLSSKKVTPTSKQAKRIIGYLAETPQLYEKLTGREHLALMGQLFEMPTSEIEERSTELLDLFELSEPADKMVETYSKGMSQKLALSLALIHGPKVLILDEPTNGLDPKSARTVKDVLLQVKEQGLTVLISTHLMELVDELCDSVYIIHDGKIRASGSLDKIKAEGKGSLEDAFLQLTGGQMRREGPKWLKD